MPKIKNEDQPWIENYPPLKEWLNRHEATCYTQVRYGNNMIEMWFFPKSSRLAIITINGAKRGWDIWTPADTNKIDATFEDAEKRLGLGPTLAELQALITDDEES